MSETYQPTPDLPGELYPNRHVYFDEVMRMANELPEESPLDSEDPWQHIWLPKDEKMGEVARAGAAQLAGFKYFLGHNGMINIITSLTGESVQWLPVMKMSWLKSPRP